MGLRHTQQKRSRLRASILDTFPLFPPSFLHILHSSHNPLSPNSTPPLHPLPSITSCLCFGSRRSKSQGCSSQEQCCHGVGVREKKRKIGALSREDQTRAPLCSSWVEWGRRKRQKDWGTGGWVGCVQRYQVSFIVEQHAVAEASGS